MDHLIGAGQQAIADTRRERERDRATMQAHIAEVKRADRAGQTPEQEAPARSKAGDH